MITLSYLRSPGVVATKLVNIDLIESVRSTDDPDVSAHSTWSEVRLSSGEVLQDVTISPRDMCLDIEEARRNRYLVERGVKKRQGY